MINLRQNIVLQFTVVILVAVFLTSSILGAVISRQNTAHLIRTHIQVYPNLIQSIIKDHPSFYRFLESPPGAELPHDARLFLEDLLTFGSVFRVKVWDRESTILWSDRSELIGKNFRDNILFQKAMKGEVSAQHIFPAKSENYMETAHGIVLEIYTPIINSGSPVGVIEIYESDRELFAEIQKSGRIIWKIVSATGGVLYVMLFGIFFGAYSRQKKTTAHLIETQEVTIVALASQAEIRDIETGLHLERTSRYVRLLAGELRKHPRYSHYLSDEYIADLVKSTPLHDIGKVGVPDKILLKPGILSESERAEMIRHCEYGATVLRRAEAKLSSPSFLTIAVQLVQNHHEKWNGRGYPRGLKGEEIPLSARIMALADVYDALRSRRHYKNAIPHEECVEIIEKEKGEHFDPLIVDAFLSRKEEFRAISEQMADR